MTPLQASRENATIQFDVSASLCPDFLVASDSHETILLEAHTAIRFTQNGKGIRESEKFRRLADQWRRETRFSSSLDEKILHPAYQSIIAMGASAVPYVLAELESQGGHWFWALHFMTGVDPVPEGSKVNEARQAWLKWGREKGLLN